MCSCVCVRMCRGCPVGYSCRPNMGDNAEPYVNFDNLGWAIIAVNQIITLDNTDDLYDKVKD